MQEGPASFLQKARSSALPQQTLTFQRRGTSLLPSESSQPAGDKPGFWSSDEQGRLRAWSIRRNRSHLRGSVHFSPSESRLLAEQVPALPDTQTCVRGTVCEG